MSKERISWYIYDFAKTAFNTSAISVFIGPYFNQIVNNTADINGNILFFNIINISAGSFYPFIVAISLLLQVLILPICSYIADNTNYSKHILFIATYCGSITTMCFFFINENNYNFGAILFIIANICFGLATSIYNSYFNYITTKENATKISSIGWGAGFLGGGILLLLNLLLYNYSEMLSIDKNLVIRINLLSAGLWWAIFSIIPLIYFRKITNKKLKENYLNVIKNTTNRSTILIFLTAYTLYSSGIQAIITLSALFVNAELKITMDIIIIGILILQFVAVIGAILFNLIAKNTTNLASLKINLIIWIIAIIFAYLLLQDVTDFFVLCIIIGITIGGTQAISRSIFSQLIPKSKEAQFFSIYELSGKVLSWLGVLFFGLVYQITLSYRLSILSIVLFFALGFVLLCIKGKREKV